MAERRSGSLLGFAIAASLAVLPVMLGMLLLVSVIRPAQQNELASRATAERYLSVRHVAALKSFEQAVVPRDGPAAPTPRAQDVLAGLPACRAEWGAGWHASGPSPADRVAAQLSALDRSLWQFSTRDNARVAHGVGLDMARWFEAARALLGRTVEAPGYPGQRFQVGCADLAGALTALTRADAHMLETLAWRGTEATRVLARWRPEQWMEIAPHQVARRNPWTGVAGCLYLRESEPGAGRLHFVGAPALQQVCALPAMAGASAPSKSAMPLATALGGEPTPDMPADDARWQVPPSLQTLLQPLESLRQPGGALYRSIAERNAVMPASTQGARANNRVTLDGTSVDAGFSVDLTIDPALQALAQKTAACYTGRQDLCRALDIRRVEDKDQPIGHKLLEGAMVRMAAVAVIDVASGRIEALAGALSPCTREEFDGPGRDAGCDKRLPFRVQYRPDALMNPSVFHDAMPASTIKPIMAAAFLSDPNVGPRWLAAERKAMKPGAVPAADSLRGQLMRSDSARFLDRMFCSEKNYADCGRPWEVQAMAPAFGWNADCDQPRLDCGKRDLLFGRALDAPANASAPAGPLAALSMPVAFGRLMSAPSGASLASPMHLAPHIPLPPRIVSVCAAGADGRRLSEDDWTKCRGGAVVDVVAEGWGQGHARSSALGVAGMMATLAAAANGQTTLHRPHLVDAVRGAGLGTAATRWTADASEPNRLSHDAAEVIVDGLRYSHRYGTARTACEEVFDAKACKQIEWIAGKTGTPSFPNDGVPLDEIARACRGETTKKPRHGASAECSSLRPYKWYVATYRDASGTGPWTKAIAVLTERNWIAKTGQVHGVGDHGPNPSAEIALQIVGRRLGVIAGSAP